MNPIDIIVSGYPSLDRIIKLDSEPRTGFTSIITDRSDEKLHFGGCNINIAYTAAKLGINALPSCYVGDDYKSSGLQKFLKDGGVRLDALTEVQDQATSRSYLIEDKNGNHITLFYPGAMDCAKEHEVDDILVAGARYCVVTVGEPRSNLSLARKADAFNIPLVFGMKCDFNAFTEQDLRFMLFSAEVIFMNEHEKKVICNFLGLTNIKELFTGGRCRVLVTTKGESGSSIMYQDQDAGITEKDIPLIPADRVCDTTGVGDAYIAGFLTALCGGADWYRAAIAGAAVSSFIVEGEGCLGNVPDRMMVNERTKKYLQQEIL